MKGDKAVAIKFYEEANDYMSLVRMMCHSDDIEKAAQIAETTGDPAACYYLAGRYEALGMLPTAVHFYTRATAYTNAIRLCKVYSCFSKKYRQYWEWDPTYVSFQVFDSSKNFMTKLFIAERALLGTNYKKFSVLVSFKAVWGLRYFSILVLKFAESEYEVSFCENP